MNCQLVNAHMALAILHKTLGYTIGNKGERTTNKTCPCPLVETNGKTTHHMRKPLV